MEGSGIGDDETVTSHGSPAIHIWPSSARIPSLLGVADSPPVLVKVRAKLPPPRWRKVNGYGVFFVPARPCDRRNGRRGDGFGIPNSPAKPPARIRMAQFALGLDQLHARRRRQAKANTLTAPMPKRARVEGSGTD